MSWKQAGLALQGPRGPQGPPGNVINEEALATEIWRVRNELVAAGQLDGPQGEPGDPGPPG